MAQFNAPQPTQQAASNSIFSTQAPQPQRPTSDLFASMSPPAAISQPSSKPSTPVPPAFNQFQQPQQPKKSDPFAALATPPRQASPFQFQQATSKSPPPPSQSSGGGIDLLGMGNAPPTTQQRPSSSQANNDDEWTFSSALPDQPTDIVVTDSAVKTIFSVSRSGDQEITIQSRISNSTSNQISDLTFQLAVTKVSVLNLLPAFQSLLTDDPTRAILLISNHSLPARYHQTNRTASLKLSGYKALNEGRATQSRCAGVLITMLVESRRVSRAKLPG
jgi:ADP-ribosylation factor-binding protein GGA